MRTLSERSDARLSIGIWAALAGVVLGRLMGPPTTTTPTAAPVTVTAVQTVVVTAAPIAPTSSSRSADAPSAHNRSLAQLLASLPVKGRAPKTGYTRGQFGQAWFDADRNGCDTRNDVLRRDLRDVALKPGTRGCVVLTGTLVDPYTGTIVPFERGPRSGVVQIDHVVSLSDAWQKGAQQLSADQRQAFANDPLNLLAVSGSANAQKGDGDAATWLPKAKAFRCRYVATQITVKARWGLWVTGAEKDALQRVLRSCPTEPVPE